MRQRTWIVVVLLALVASACGTALSDEEALSELRAEGGSALRVGATGGSSGNGQAFEAGNNDALEIGGDSGVGPATAGAGGGGGGGSGGGQAAGSGDQGGGGGGGGGQACTGGGATDIGVTESDIRLGWVGTLEGPQPGLFKGALAGTRAWINYQNSQGGLMCRRLSLVPADDSLDSGRNRAAHLQLKDRVFSFVGSFSINDDGGASVINECKCPDVSGNLSTQMHESPYHFGPQPAPSGWRSGPPRYYAKKYGPEVTKKLAFFFSQVGAAIPIAQQMRRVYEEAGFEVVYTRGITPNDTNQTADVVQMRQAGVRAIAFQGDLLSMSRLTNAMQQQDFSVDLLNLGNAVYDAKTFEATTPEALKNLQIDQVYGMFLGEDGERTPEVKLFNEWMQKTAPDVTVDLFAMYGWLSGRLFADAMTKMAQEGKTPVRADLIATLTGWKTWDGNGMVAPVEVGTKRASDCFFIFTATKDAKFVRTFPEGQENYACDQGPFSYKP